MYVQLLEGDQYPVSVIIPFHNVDIKLFQKCVQSIREQSIGADSIELIVVVHNCRPGYLQTAKELTADMPHVAIYELNNDKHVASSPRNYGIDRANGRYIGFLDADDAYNPQCVEEALKAISETQSQMVAFRNETVLENENLMDMNMFMLMDQTEERIVLEHDTWDSSKFVFGQGLAVTSKMYDRHFINQEHLRFNEEVPVAEDNLFNLHVLNFASRICFLPQMIGYVYYLNGASIMQNSSKSREEILKYVRGTAEVVKYALSTDLQTNSLRASMLGYASNLILTCRGLTHEDRVDITNLMTPYVKTLEPLTPNKLMSPMHCKMIPAVINMVLLNPDFVPDASMSMTHLDAATAEEQEVLEYLENSHAARVSTTEQLVHILQENQNTDFGKKYKFDAIKTLTTYQRNVPLANYDTFAPMIGLTTHIGESGIYTANPVVSYALTSGTTGVPRLIPCTKRHLNSYVRAFEKLDAEGSTFLLMDSMPKKSRFKGNTFMNSITGEVLQRVKDTLPCCSYQLPEKSHGFTAPEELLFPTEMADTTHTRLLFALLDRKVEHIVAPFTWGVMEMCTYLENHWQELVEDIEKGSISKSVNISEEFRATLEQKLKADTTRAAELKAIFEQGFEKPILPLVWPGLKRVVAAGTGAFQIYTDKLERYFGKLPHDNGYYAASEALLAKATGENADTYKFFTNTGVFEFLPVVGTKEELQCALSMSDLEVGKQYEVLVTNNAGLYRYRLGDVICVKAMEDGVPTFTYEYRTDETASLFAEHLSEKDVYRAVLKMQADTGVAFADFCIKANEDNDKYTLLLEPEEQQKNLTALHALTLKELAELAENAMQDVSAPYTRARKIGQLEKMEVLILQPQTQILYRDVKRYRGMVAQDQIKPVRLLTNPAVDRFFSTMIDDEMKA